MRFYIVVFLFTFFLVYLLVPITKRVALSLGVVDQPNARKIHRSPIPLSGGLAIYLGMVATLVLFFELTLLHFVLVWGGLILLGVGFIDDWYKSKGRDFPAWPKLVGQVGSAILAYLTGIRFFGLGAFWTGNQFYFFPDWMVFLATVVWIVGFINMINFLDGMDGLAGGVTAISATTLFAIAILRGQLDVAVLSIILIGSSLAFLKHNFHPASVFLGDAGSMFLGYTIAVTSLYGTMKSATLVTLIITILALGVPIFDTVQVIFSRIKAGTPIYKADRRHVHHRLMHTGLSQRQTVLVIYGMSILFSILSLLLLFLSG